ncbi:hypothetical protein [Streptomyces sp. NPDC059076]|uniref:hypothetical protein n=1 Tax=unclassified Streptomyces TaxID=2593676 RepID=UPI0036C3A4F8
MEKTSLFRVVRILRDFLRKICIVKRNPAKCQVQVHEVVLMSVLGIHDVPEARLAAAIHMTLLGFSFASSQANEALLCGLSAAHGHGIGYLAKRDPTSSSLSEQSFL